MRISIIIVTYNSSHLMQRCLAPLLPLPHDCEVIVWDNGSGDGTGQLLRDEFPEVRLIESGMNSGFSKGNNSAAALAKGEFLILLNPDAFVSGWSVLDQMIGAMSRSGAAIAGPQLVNLDGSHQVGDAGWRLSLLSLMGHFLFLHRLFAEWPALYLTNTALLSREQLDVDWICGACLVTRKDTFDRIGGLDEDVFMYGEDTEWGERAKSHGLRVLYFPAFRVLHLRGGTQRSERVNFVSLKWIDNIMHRSGRPGAFRRTASAAIMASGLMMRSILAYGRFAFGGSLPAKVRAELMWRYLSHTVSRISK